MTIVRNARTVSFVYASAFVQGIALITFPAAGNILKDPQFHALSSSQYGLLFMPMILLAVTGSLISGPWSLRAGMKTVAFAGIGSNLLSMVLLAATGPFMNDAAFLQILAATSFLGFGFGTTISSMNALAVELFSRKEHSAVTGLHASLGLGTATSPILLNIFVGAGSWWVSPLMIAGLLFLLFLLGAGASLPSTPASGGKAPIAFFSAPARLWIFAAVLVLYGVSEATFSNWAVIYLHEDKGIGMEEAGFALSAFWGMQTVGRIGAAVITAYAFETLLFVISPVLITLSLWLIPSISGSTQNILMYGAAGLACSYFSPLTIAIASKEQLASVATVSGLMMASIMAGVGLGSFGSGALREQGNVALSTIHYGVGVFGVVMAVLVFFLSFHLWREKKGRKI